MIRLPKHGNKVAQALAAFACLALGWMTPGFANETGPVIPEHPSAPITLDLSQISQEQGFTDLLGVFVGPEQECCTGRSPLAGAYEIVGQNLQFRPAFEFVEGQRYTLRWQLPSGKFRTKEFEIGAPQPPPEVIGISPGGAVIPENNLRFYIDFSSPMSPHASLDKIALVDSEGRADENAFMSFKKELWNEDRTRLTVLMDPGRIKRGVAQNLRLGPALERGNSYEVTVKEGWTSASGSGTAQAYSYAFNVGPPLRTLPEVDHWRVIAPNSRTNDPFQIEFDRPFDLYLLYSHLSLFDPNGTRIRGKISVDETQRRWSFEPKVEWDSRQVYLVVDARLEDVAGNNFREVLDHHVDFEPREIDEIELLIDLGDASDGE